MFKKPRFILFAVASFLSIGIFIISFAQDGIFFLWTFGEIHNTGSFSTGWNAGITSFDMAPAGYSGAQVITFATSTGVYLTGIFWLQTVWWATFSDVGMGMTEMVPPSAWKSFTDPWYLSGYAWSENAWWIKFNHGESMASWVWFIPNTTLLKGYAWSDTLGWISFDSGAINVGSGFIGKLGIGGSIGGNKSFDTLYSPWTAVNVASLGRFLNTVRKNISIISRNAEGNHKINIGFWGASPVAFNHSMIFKMTDNPSDTYLTYSKINTSFDNLWEKTRSLIVVWGDLYIDTDVTSPLSFWFPRTLVVFKNEAWQWGNIYIKWSVKTINASLIAERTIWSGDDIGVPGGSLSPYYNHTARSLLTNIPKTQLSIRGFIASYNTIWGAAKLGESVCPAFTKNSNEVCDFQNAVAYDWNYFRQFDSTAGNRAYKDSSKDAYSVIMEPDPRVIQDPPPGLEDVRD